MDPKKIKPQIISTAAAGWRQEIKLLKLKHPEINIIDRYEEQIIELFQIRHPKEAANNTLLQNFISQYTQKKVLSEHGNWIYYAWLNTLVHLLNENEYQEVRTARNRPIISTTQQAKLMSLSVGIVGLSVGNAIAQNLAYSGAANQIKIADADNLELSNLNRVQASIVNLGENKAVIAAKQIYQINPYAKVVIYEQKINANNLKDFLLSTPKLDVVIDECDDLTLKNYLRLTARALKLPFLSVTDVGLESQVDFHRFDLSSKTAGMKEVPDFALDDLLEAYRLSEKLKLSPKEQLKLIVEIVGAKNVSVEMQKGSIERAEFKIAGWPQLAMTVFAGASLATFTLLLFTMGHKTYARQKTFSFNQLLKPEHNSPKALKQRQAHYKKFLRYLRSIK